MENEVFKFHVRNLAYGWCRVQMLINDKEIEYNASYMGPNPLESFLDACADYKNDYNIHEGRYHITWVKEPGQMVFLLNLDEKRMLHLDITDIDEDGERIYGEWHEVIPYDIFEAAIISEGFRVLYAFGLYGYRVSWQNHVDFPLSNLLYISGMNKEIWNGDSCYTNIEEELKCINDHIEKLKITEETRFKSCFIYYESWQIQCCGDPFSVGNKIEWSCTMPTDIKNAHGIIMDFQEEHHGFSTHNITGTVTKIIAERSEFPKGERIVWYNRAPVIREELQQADGWESELKGDDTTDRTFWGYIVELKDVIVKPMFPKK